MLCGQMLTPLTRPSGTKVGRGADLPDLAPGHTRKAHALGNAQADPHFSITKAVVSENSLERARFVRDHLFVLQLQEFGLRIVPVQHFPQLIVPAHTLHLEQQAIVSVAPVEFLAVASSSKLIAGLVGPPFFCPQMVEIARDKNVSRISDHVRSPEGRVRKVRTMEFPAVAEEVDIRG